MRADKSLSPFEIRLYRHYRIVHGIRIAPAFIFTFLLVRLFSIPEGTWPLITLVVIMGPISFWGNVVPRAFERIGGTIPGAALGLVALRPELFFLTADAGVVCDSDVFVRLAGLREKTVSGATDRHNARRCCRRSRW